MQCPLSHVISILIMCEIGQKHIHNFLLIFGPNMLNRPERLMVMVISVVRNMFNAKALNMELGRVEEEKSD